MIVLVTGSNGFIGTAVIDRLVTQSNYKVRAAIRCSGRQQVSDRVELCQIGELTPTSDWSAVLEGVEIVIHLAARAHVLKEDLSDSLEEFRKVNVAGTLNLARQAVAAGVKRFVFISSIGVNGNQNDRPFTEVDAEAPVEPYAVSKMEAEKGLRQLADESGMEVVIKKVSRCRLELSIINAAW